jgi:hypothetical protein
MPCRMPSGGAWCPRADSPSSQWSDSSRPGGWRWPLQVCGDQSQQTRGLDRRQRRLRPIWRARHRHRIRDLLVPPGLPEGSGSSGPRGGCRQHSGLRTLRTGQAARSWPWTAHRCRALDIRAHGIRTVLAGSADAAHSSRAGDRRVPPAGATGSRGAHLRADPALTLADPADRAQQVTRRLRQIVADAGLTGMERLAQLQLPSTPPLARRAAAESAAPSAPVH